MKICSLLPSATETLFALGLGDQVAGVSHECDFPPEARRKPVVVRSRICTALSPAEIDHQVRAFSARGESIYSVDVCALAAIEPDLIVTQDLCHVCAATPDDLGAALSHLERSPQIVTLNSHSLAGICADIRKLGDATSRAAEAAKLVACFERRVAKVSRSAKGKSRKRVVCLEWLDPLYVAGHWVPEMVACAGGVDVLGRAQKPSCRVDWDDVIRAQPDVIVVMPCGYNLERAVEEFAELPFPPAWRTIPAVRNDCIFVFEAAAHFSRPGPRVVFGIAALAKCFQFAGIPELRGDFGK